MAERCDAVVGGTFGRFVRCCRLAGDGAACPWCNTSVFWCSHDGHAESALQNIEGHKLRCHPERMPEAVALVASDPTRLAMVREAAAMYPEQYAALVEALRQVGAFA